MNWKNLSPEEKKLIITTHFKKVKSISHIEIEEAYLMLLKDNSLETNEVSLDSYKQIFLKVFPQMEYYWKFRGRRIKFDSSWPRLLYNRRVLLYNNLQDWARNNGGLLSLSNSQLRYYGGQIQRIKIHSHLEIWNSGLKQSIPLGTKPETFILP